MQRQLIEFLSFSVVVGAVHDKVYPAICYLSDKEDREFLIQTNYFHNQKIFSADRLGLREDFCIPLTAAVVELAALDMRTTPLDRYYTRFVTNIRAMNSNSLVIGD